MRVLAAMVVGVATAAAAEQATPAPEAGDSGSVLIEKVPHVRQKPDFCGEACAEMYLRKLGKGIDQDAVFCASGLDPLRGRGCHARELVMALNRIGFKTGPVWHRVKPGPKAARGVWRDLLADLRGGVPSIVCMHYDDSPKTTEHFRLVLGYDADKDEVIYHEPAEEDGEYARMARSMFVRLWPLKYGRREWTVIRMRLEPGRIRNVSAGRAGAGASALTDADYAQHVMALKKRLPGNRFTIAIAKPFVVIGDEPARMVRLRAKETVKWAANALKKGFFKKDPAHVLDVWLFKDAASYQRNARKLFGSKPDTPFGYYSAHDRALVMNIDTGGGTLVHEIVHPFMEANFPNCPPWFNEGLGSLYEQ